MLHTTFLSSPTTIIRSLIPSQTLAEMYWCSAVSSHDCLNTQDLGTWLELRLDVIDRAVKVNLNNSQDEDVWMAFMFDQSFLRSKLYFTVLETLRISNASIKDTFQRWEELHEQWRQELEPKTFDEVDVRAVEVGWEAVTRTVRTRASVLQCRIARKTEEVKSLRDGLFNATALREATKGVELNKAVYISTFVTVIFNPVSFLAISHLNLTLALMIAIAQLLFL
ncbi:hypothetical protein B0T16DRAFT_418530 [Cercophora newfieldiana]|uniref:Uncharacterized protein n=1 Tax=Cercophora newfieldiana TaxID=92897 RepID=A0AA39XWT1_9PEZI|nr:hypothetical protein B0T16DRAFT_418530 [Cercophora newfieldiana]